MAFKQSALFCRRCRQLGPQNVVARHYGKRPLSGPLGTTLDNILDHIGNTPLVRLNRVTKDVDCEVVAKCEFFNAGGSVKDRIGKRMVEDAEKSGRLKPGDTIIEPTSGNTGIGLALAAAVKGYKMIVTLPEKMSNEKVNVLKALGADVIRTPDWAGWDHPDSHIGVAKRLNEEIPNSHILDQYSNPSNPDAHYEETAEEILQQTDYKLDAIVATAGTGGTVSGIGKKIKEKLPNCQVIAVDPTGSILARPESLNEGGISPYKVEGIGYDFIPDVLTHDYIDLWLKSNDVESFQMCRRLIKEEGLLCGGSCGSAVVAALEVARGLKKGQRVAVILPDSTRNYMTKFLDPDWMINFGFYEPPKINEPWAEHPVSELDTMTKAFARVPPTTECRVALGLLEKDSLQHIAIVDDNGEPVGTIGSSQLFEAITSGRINPESPVNEIMELQFKTVDSDASIGDLSQYLKYNEVVLVTSRGTLSGVVSRRDMASYVMNAPDKQQQRLP